MTTQLLATELANLIQESKRKHNDLRQAAEKSLEELKNLRNPSEQTAPEELSHKVNFVNPFIIACGTKNAKFTAIAIVCLQRLIVSRALPRSKLNQVLEALMQAASAGLDVQLKILQALPSLLQNYSSDLQGNLLVTVLNICFTLQSSKNAIVSHTSAATLQQLVVSVFDKVVVEDKKAGEGPGTGDSTTAEGKSEPRPAALDAYRIFNDLCLMTENQRPEFLRFSGLPQTFGLELIESVITNHATVFTNHPEQAQILRVRVMPLITSALKGRPNFATTVRLVRILYTIVRRHIAILPAECGQSLVILTQLLDQDDSLWKRALCMEVFRGVFAEHALLRRIFSNYDAKEGERNILKPLFGTFVRLSTEKPAVIGLGHQSTMPTSNVQPNSTASDQALIEASGVTGIISGSVSSETTNTGISTQWSSVRVPFIDQLDKTEAPPIPESYIYSLVLACISSVSDGLAKFILPLTVPSETRGRRKTSKDTGRDSPTPSQLDPDSQPSRGKERSASFKRNPVPLNPLALVEHPLFSDIKICAAIVDECWPAILATCSTFLYAALDSEYYHGLVRAFQRFAHVAGLLHLATPRDAFLTTLGKAAVPPNVITACLNAGQARPQTPSTPTDTSSLFSNARGLLSVDSLASTTPTAEKQRQVSFDATSATLNTRNLLCLRALLNLGIALGPTLSHAWSIILETLQQADFVLFVTAKTPGRTPSLSRGVDQGGENDASALMANFGSEVRSVETAASRLIESTVDFPNESFMEVVTAICNLLIQPSIEPPVVADQSQSESDNNQQLQAPAKTVRRFSAVSNPGSTQEDQFALAKLGEIATINIERLMEYPPAESGWTVLVDELTRTLTSSATNSSVRTRAAEILVRLTLEAATVTASLPGDSRGEIQLRLFEALRSSLAPLLKGDREVSVANQATDIDIHKIVLDGLKSIIEGCGESLVSGWDIAFEIIGTIFITKKFNPADRRGSLANPILLVTRSARLIRASFNSLQLICSDFLASLPNSCFLILVDILYKFCSQDDDLNIALTTVTFFWVVSDFLSAKNESLDITAEMMQKTGVSDLQKMAAEQSSKGSDAALWMLLLLRLTTVTTDDRLELRNSAIQTLLRIFDAYGERLSPEAWSICIKSVIFKLLTSIEEELRAAESDEVDESDRTEWTETTEVVLNGISSLLANYLDILTVHPSFNHLWRELLGHFTTLLDFKVLDINTAAFKALGHILSQTSDDGKPTFNTPTIDVAWDLWSRKIPTSKATTKSADNQKSLIAYVSALVEIYRLICDDLTVERVQRMLTLLRATLEEASISGYTADIEYVTPLQAQILEAIQMIRTDIAGVPSAMISQVAEFVLLAFSQADAQRPGSKRTYIALSKASMKAMEKLILNHFSDQDIYRSGAFSKAMNALCKPIALKYRFATITKSTQPWRLSTSSVLVILEATLSQLIALELSRSVTQNIWSTIVAIADGILGADCDTASSGTNLEDDETFDIASFHKLRELIIPALGAEAISDKTRKAYGESLFRTSIIHAASPVEESITNGSHELGLSALYSPRPGRTVSVPPTKRTRMAYVACQELFSLIASMNEPTIVIQPPTPKSPYLKHHKLAEAPAALHARIASTAAPFLIFRCGLTLQAYVADQPLRGKMPQPLSQRKELLWILRKLVDLQSESGAIPELSGVESEGRKHLLRLYPLIVRATGVVGDEKVQGLLREALEAVGGELGV
ncbi:Endocytosis and vacuole integrity protein [Neonectria magnoliae]|uniref:Endocytosis and vacuole integrity protein n=1 Tax=Neonectria magnoliae TaxID=2732573 RepID=A0ABR1HXP5_9HYPO